MSIYLVVSEVALLLVGVQVDHGGLSKGIRAGLGTIVGVVGGTLGIGVGALDVGGGAVVGSLK